MKYGYSRRELVTFLRAIAQAADNGDLGVEHQKMMLNGDLMREAADMLAQDKDQHKEQHDTARVR